MLGLQNLRVWEGNMMERVGKRFYDLRTKSIDGKKFDLKAVEGRVVLICNIATKCEFSKANFEALVRLDNKYRGELQILAFPSTEFGRDDGLKTGDVQDFAHAYHARFHMMEKTRVNGPDSHEVFKALKRATGTEDTDIAWNYETKFLVDREGNHVERFSNCANPMLLVPFIDRLVGETEPHDEEPRVDNLTKSDASFVNTG